MNSDEFRNCVSDQTWPPSGHLSVPAASVSVQTSDLTKATKLLKPIHLERLPLLQKILFPNGADVSGTLSSEQAKKKNETCDNTVSHLAEKRRNVRSSVSKRSCQLTNSILLTFCLNDQCEDCVNILEARFRALEGRLLSSKSLQGSETKTNQFAGSNIREQNFLS